MVLMRAWAKTGSDHILVYAAVALALAPVGYLIWASFDMAGLGQPYRFGFSGWFEAFSAPATLSTVGTSFLLGLRVLPALAVALFISWALVRHALPHRGFIESSVWFAFFLPPVPMAIAWTLLLHPAYGLINAALAHVPFLPAPMFSIQSIAGIMWVHLTVSTVPFLVIVLIPAIRQLDMTFEEAARVSGSGALNTALRVTYPLLAPAILAGLLATFSRGLESFEVEQIIGPPVGIYVFATQFMISSARTRRSSRKQWHFPACSFWRWPFWRRSSSGGCGDDRRSPPCVATNSANAGCPVTPPRRRYFPQSS